MGKQTGRKEELYECRFTVEAGKEKRVTESSRKNRRETRVSRNISIIETMKTGFPFWFPDMFTWSDVYEDCRIKKILNFVTMKKNASFRRNIAERTSKAITNTICRTVRTVHDYYTNRGARKSPPDVR